MRVVLLNHSDTRGGASVVTFRLMEALCRLGVDARMVVMNKASSSMRVDTLQPEWRRKAAFLAEHARIYLGNGFSRDDLFKVSIANVGMDVHSHPWVREADVVCLNWVNQGMMSLSEIDRIEAPLVWTMHDMWPFTGVCHHAGECMGYTTSCGRCPLLHWDIEHDLSYSTQRRKHKLYDRKPITFVAVSNWLAESFSRSALGRNRRVRVIPNAFPADSYRTSPTLSRNALGLPEGKRLIIMGAARLDDPIKGLECAVAVLNRVYRGKMGSDCAAVFFGDLRNPHALSELEMPYVHLGTVSDPRRLAEIYAHCDVVLSTSCYETLPGTLIEGMAAGCVPVAFDRGGQSDIVTHLSTGYLATDADLPAGIEFALSSGIPREKLHAEVASRFSAQYVANQYINLFKELGVDNYLP